MNEGGTRVHLSTGDQGRGKSYRLGAEVLLWAAGDARRRVLVADIAPEWPYGPLRGRCRYAIARTAKGAARLIRQHRVVVVRIELAESDRPTAAIVSELAEVACDTPCEVGLVVPEIHLAAPAHHSVLPRGLLRVLHQSRKNRVVLFADTQHPAQTSRKVQREARWYVHATRDGDDQDRIMDAVKRAHRPQDRPAALRRIQDVFVELDASPPGYHVIIDGARSELEPRR